MKRIALALLVAAATPAAAQPKSKPAAEAAYKAGQTKYLTEDYVGAADDFKVAYENDPDPGYLFNIGQAYRNAKRCADAATYYRRYLDEAKPAPNEAIVKAYIVELDECAKQQAPVTAPPPRPQVAEPVPPPPAPVAPAPEGHGSSSRRTLALVIGGAGALIAANGFYFMRRVSKDEDKARAVCDPSTCTAWDESYNAQIEAANADGRRDEKIMVASWLVGGAALATGVVLFVMTGDAKTESPVAVTPTRNGAMVSLSF